MFIFLFLPKRMQTALVSNNKRINISALAPHNKIKQYNDNKCQLVYKSQKKNRRLSDLRFGGFKN